MINRIELTFGDQLQEVRKLDSDRSALFQERLEPRYEVIDVGNVRQHVIRGDKIGRMLVLQTQRGLASEERNFTWNAFLDRSRGDVLCRLDSLNRDVALCEELKQVAVVACDLDDLRVRAKPQRLDHFVG